MEHAGIARGVKVSNRSAGMKFTKIAALAVAVTLFQMSVAPAQNSVPSSALSRRNTLPIASIPSPPSSPSLTIPAETQIAVQLLTGIHSQVSHVDDPVKAQLVQPVYVDGLVALPLGSLLDGRITRVRSAGRLRRPAELVFRFDRITLPDGEEEPISAALAAFDKPRPPKTQIDPEGHLKGARVFSWKLIAGGFASFGGLTAKTVLAGTSPLGTILPASGAALLAYEIVVPRGNEVHVPPQTSLRLRLNYPLTVRVVW